MRKNLGLKLFALFLSLLLWFQQSLLQEHTVALSIPVRLVNIPSRLIPAGSNLKKSIKVQIKARGIDIFLIKYLKVYFKIDASGFDYGNNNVKLNLSNLAIPEHVNIKITDLKLKERFVVPMDRLVTKKKNINIRYASAKDLEYFLKNKIDLTDKKAKVRGALSDLNRIKKIDTEKVSRKDVENGFISVRLIPPSKDIVVLNPEIKLRVIQQKSIIKTISLIPISYPPNAKVTLIPQKVSVIIRGPQNIVNKVTKDSIVAYVDKNDVKKSGLVIVKFKTPNGVEIIDFTPRKVQVIK